jgi:hypothetical protein
LRLQPERSVARAAGIPELCQAEGCDPKVHGLTTGAQGFLCDHDQKLSPRIGNPQRIKRLTGQTSTPQLDFCEYSDCTVKAESECKTFAIWLCKPHKQRHYDGRLIDPPVETRALRYHGKRADRCEHGGCDSLKRIIWSARRLKWCCKVDYRRAREGDPMDSPRRVGLEGDTRMQRDVLAAQARYTISVEKDSTASCV